MPSPYAFTIGDDKVFFDPHPGVQLDVVQRIARRVRFGEGPSKFFLRGNRGSGKSVLVRKGVCHALALACPGLRYGVIRRNMPDLRTNHLIYVGAELRALGGEWNETHAMAKYPNGSLGFFRPCEDATDVEKIVGAELHLLFVDEAPQIAWEFLRTISPSIRVASDPGGRPPFWPVEVYGGNPMGDSIDELDHYFVDQDVDTHDDPLYDPADWCHIPIQRTDNPSLDEREYLKQFAGVPAHFRAAWIDGIRMDARTLFDVIPRKDGQAYHYIEDLPTVDGTPLLRVPWIQVYRAFDMGYYPDPAVCLWLAVLGRRVLAIHEATYFRTVAKDLAAKIQDETRELIGDTPVVMTYVDPEISLRTGSDTVTVMDTLEMHGVPCEASINDRILYADAIHGLLGEEAAPGVPRLQIYTPGCPLLAKYLPKMRWDDKHERRMADSKFDHWPVCLAYFAISSGVLAFSEKHTTAAEPIWQTWLREDHEKRTRWPRKRARVS